MFVAIGYVIIFISVFGGFALAGGHLGSLIQPVELLMIAGSAVGSFIVANGGKPMTATLKALPDVVKGPKYTKDSYMELFALMFELLSKVRKEGLMSIEGDVEGPADSPVFGKYPLVSSDHHLVEFICDYLRMMVGGNLNAFELENLMDIEIETHHHEGDVPIHALARLGDGMPAFGIVAAVMGVVHTMESVGLPPAELGKLIAAALVGTFLGILLSYGFVTPLSVRLEFRLAEGTRALQIVKAIILASLNGYPPPTAVEFGRKVLESTDRPGFLELEEYLKNAKSR